MSFSERQVLGAVRRLYRDTYLRCYSQLRPEDKETLCGWQVVNAAARLSEGIPEEQTLLGFVKEELSR